MRKTNVNLNLLNVLFVTSLIISNVVTSKLINIGVTVNNTPVILPGAMFCYAVTFLITDIIGEVWGKKQANDCVKLGFICQIVACVLIFLTKLLPSYTQDIEFAYNLILGQNYIYVIASLLAYWCSQTWDVFIFHKIRNAILSKTNNTSYKWVWNNLSTLTSQMIDTAIFIIIGFGFGMKWLFIPQMLPILGYMIIGQYIFKAILAILDTPFFYWFTRERK